MKSWWDQRSALATPASSIDKTERDTMETFILVFMKCLLKTGQKIHYSKQWEETQLQIDVEIKQNA